MKGTVLQQEDGEILTEESAHIVYSVMQVSYWQHAHCSVSTQMSAHCTQATPRHVNRFLRTCTCSLVLEGNHACMDG